MVRKIAMFSLDASIHTPAEGLHCSHPPVCRVLLSFLWHLGEPPLISIEHESVYSRDLNIAKLYHSKCLLAKPCHCAQQRKPRVDSWGKPVLMTWLWDPGPFSCPNYSQGLCLSHCSKALLGFFIIFIFSC